MVDGIFGPATQQAVLTLQRQLGFDPTGAVGPVLWSQIITLGEEYWKNGRKGQRPFLPFFYVFSAG